jgi:hypothetical protein
MLTRLRFPRLQCGICVNATGVSGELAGEEFWLSGPEYTAEVPL